MTIKQNRKGEARKTHHKALPSRWSRAPGLQMWGPNLGIAALKTWVSAPERRTGGDDSANPAPGAAHRTRAAVGARASPLQPGLPGASLAGHRAPGLRSVLCPAALGTARHPRATHNLGGT